MEKTRIKYKFSEDGIEYYLSLDTTSGSFGSLEGLSSFKNSLTIENWKYCGARASGSGIRNFKRFRKAVKYWDKKTFSNLIFNLKLFKVDYWTK